MKVKVRGPTVPRQKNTKDLDAKEELEEITNAHSVFRVHHRAIKRPLSVVIWFIFSCLCQILFIVVNFSILFWPSLA